MNFLFLVSGRICDPPAIPAAGDFASNRAYSAAWVEEGARNGLAPCPTANVRILVPSFGGHSCEKILRLTSP